MRQNLRRGVMLIAMLTLGFSGSVAGRSIDSLKMEGWVVVYQTTVSDEFKGCDYDLLNPLDGGYIFVCREYNYVYSYRPDFLIVKRDTSTKFVIGNEEFEA